MDGERDQRLRAGLLEAGLDAVLAWRTEEIVLTTGECPHWGMTLCLYPRVGTPVVYAMALEPADLLPTHMTQRRFMSERQELQALITADIQALGIQRVGYSVEMGRHALPGNTGEFPPFSTSLIVYLLEGVTAQPTDVLSQQMQRKTAHEVDKIKLAHHIAARGLRTFYDFLQPGITEAEVAGAIESAVQAQTGKHGSKLARGWAFVQAGANTINAGTFSRSSGYALQSGDIVVLEMATMVDGYWSDLTRTGVVGGTPNKWQAALMSAVRDAQAAALAVVRAGATHEAVDAAARQVMTARGYGVAFTHGTGHHVGFRYHDYGAGLAAGSTVPLQSGNVVTIEPGAYGVTVGGGSRFEDNVLVTEIGYEMLSPHEVVS